MSELSALRAQYKELSGRNASPSMKADALQAKIVELQAAAAAPPAQDPPAQDPPAQDPPAQDPPAQDPPAQDDPAADVADEPEQSVEDACAELGIEPDADGNASVELLVSFAGAECKNRGDEHFCDAAEAVRMVRAGYAKPRA
jgi:hypothetical protein